METNDRSTSDGSSKPYSEIDFDDAVHTSDQRRIYRRKPKAADNLISQIITKRGIAAEQSNNQLQGIWESIVPADVANQTRVGSVKRKVLEITVSNSGLMQILGFSKTDYLEQINLELGNQNINQLEIHG